MTTCCTIDDYPHVLSTAQVAELLGLPTIKLVQAMAKEGRIPAHKPPGDQEWRFDRDEVIAWLRSGQMPGKPVGWRDVGNDG